MIDYFLAQFEAFLPFPDTYHSMELKVFILTSGKWEEKMLASTITHLIAFSGHIIHITNFLGVGWGKNQKRKELAPEETYFLPGTVCSAVLAGTTGLRLDRLEFDPENHKWVFLSSFFLKWKIFEIPELAGFSGSNGPEFQLEKYEGVFHSKNSDSNGMELKLCSRGSGFLVKDECNSWLPIS